MRKLTLLPFGLALIYTWLPFMPKPKPSTFGCFGCNSPIWLSEPSHMLVSIPMLILTPLILTKLFWVLLGMLPDHFFYRTLSPTLWTIFLVSAAYYLLRGIKHELPMTAYDFTSLIPFIFFASVDFIFAYKLRKRK